MSSFHHRNVTNNQHKCSNRLHFYSRENNNSNNKSSLSKSFFSYKNKFQVILNQRVFLTETPDDPVLYTVFIVLRFNDPSFFPCLLSESRTERKCSKVSQPPPIRTTTLFPLTICKIKST